MKVVFIGDIFGESGRAVLAEQLPTLRSHYNPDFIIVNVDNITDGRGTTPELTDELYAMGIDLLTRGDHIWDQPEMLARLDTEPSILRPINYPPSVPGKGWHVLQKEGKKLLVVHALGRIFVDKRTENPFLSIDNILTALELRRDVDGIIIDFHAETSTEKYAMGFFLDGRVSAVLGTHTHVPTADARVLPKGTAYITDVGMTGDYNSIIGAEIEAPLQAFLTGISTQKIKPAKEVGTLCGVIIEINDDTGLASAINPIQLGAEW